MVEAPDGPTLVAISNSGSMSIELTCHACDRTGPPQNRNTLHVSHHQIASVWRKGWIACPCGASGDHLAVWARPAGTPHRLVGAWFWDANEADPAGEAHEP